MHQVTEIDSFTSWFPGTPQAVARTERRRSKRLTADQINSCKPPTSTQKTLLDLHRAMDMYELTDSELLCELKRDTRCLMGWGNSTIVLAFRGTASVTNALSDLQVSGLRQFACLFVCLAACLPACCLSVSLTVWLAGCMGVCKVVGRLVLSKSKETNFGQHNPVCPMKRMVSQSLLQVVGVITSCNSGCKPVSTGSCVCSCCHRNIDSVQHLLSAVQAANQKTQVRRS